MDTLQKKSNANIIAGIGFGVMTLVALYTLIINVVNMARFHYFNAMNFISVLLPFFAYAALAVTAFLAKFKVAPIIGLGLNALLGLVTFVGGVIGLISYLVSATRYYGVNAVLLTSRLGMLFPIVLLGSVVGLVFAIIYMAKKKPLKAKLWLIPGIAAAVGALLSLIMSVAYQIALAVQYGFSAAMVFNLFLNLLSAAGFTLGVFMLMKYLSDTASAAASEPVYAPAGAAYASANTAAAAPQAEISAQQAQQLSILWSRFSSGEITQEEYEEKRKLITGIM